MERFELQDEGWALPEPNWRLEPSWSEPPRALVVERAPPHDLTERFAQRALWGLV